MNTKHTPESMTKMVLAAYGTDSGCAFGLTPDEIRTVIVALDRTHNICRACNNYETLVEALKWYADTDNYEIIETPSHPSNDIPIGSTEIDGLEVLNDEGSRARAALAKAEEK